MRAKSIIVTMQPTQLLELTRRFAEADALDAPLDAKLADYAKRSREIIPDVLEIYDRFVAHLAASEVDRNVPQVGQELPEFVLPGPDGRLVSLSELLDSGPVVVSINRGHWCPYCRLELRALARAHPHIAKQGATIVSIVPETAEFTMKAIEAHALPFKMLTDIDLGYALSIGLVVWIGEEMAALYRKVGISLPRFQRNDAWFLPIPATFVVGQGRCIVAGFANPDFRQRMAIEQIEAALRVQGRRP